MWHSILAADKAEPSFVISGHHQASFPKSCRIRVTGKNAGNYLVTGTYISGEQTVILVNPIMPEYGSGGKLRKKKRPVDL